MSLDPAGNNPKSTADDSPQQKTPLKAAKPLKTAAPLKRAAPIGDATPAAGQTRPSVARPIPLVQATAAGITSKTIQSRQGMQEKARTGGATQAEEEEEEEEIAEGGFAWTQTYSSWASSMIFHMIGLIVLGLWAVGDKMTDTDIFVTVSEPFVEEELEELEEEKETPEITPIALKEVDALEEEQEIINAEDLNLVTEVVDEIDAGSEMAAIDDSLDVEDVLAASTDWMAEIPVPIGPGNRTGTGDTLRGGTGTGEGLGGTGRGFGGRAARRRKMQKEDYVPENDPVNLGLIWLAKHQQPDGSWSYEHRNGGDCRSQCANPGALRNAKIAATGMALLPFLGAGYDHQHGPFKRNVYGGLKYLLNSVGEDGNLWGKEGRMYGHGIATLALCEAYGLRHEAAPDYGVEEVNPDGSPKSKEQIEAEKLAKEKDELARKKYAINPAVIGKAAKAAANYINFAQGADGGWRYKPKEAGDTSVVGWQIMALKSAKDARLVFDPNVRRNALRYLDHVQSDLYGDEVYGRVGAKYSYTKEGQITRATNAIGMLCRIYMGLDINHPAVDAAVDRIQNGGNGNGDLYFAYYATQIMYQKGGDHWKNWNASLSGFLHGAQLKQGHTKGSFYFPGADHGSTQGGRLYTTAMALLCLEENYRHLRIAEEAAANENPNPKRLPPVGEGEKKPQDDFPLE